MNNYIPIICFVAGVATGILTILAGYKLGFKASYEIRNHAVEDDGNNGIFKNKKDPAEFEMLDDDKDKDT